MELTSTNNIGTNRHELKVHVNAEDLNAAINAVYKNESKKMNIPGFRRGHAPRAFIEKYYGAEVFFEAAVEHLYRPTVTEAIEKSGLEIVSVTDFKVDDISKEDGFHCTLTVVTKPEVTVEDYKGLSVTKEPVVVTEGDIDHEIEHVRERNSRTVTVEDRPAQNGDIVEIDFDGYTDGKAFDGGKAENFELTLGSGQFIPGFEEQVEGHNPGDDFEVNVTFPEDYHAEELKGKPAVFKVKLHEIKHKELPEVDDEFVKDVSEFDNLKDYRASIEKDLLSRKEKAAQQEMEEQVVEALIEKVQAEIPEEMVENEVDEMINSFSYRLQSQGLSLETYLKYTEMTTENLRDQYKPQAERQLKTRLGLEKVAQLEGIEPTEEEVEAEYDRLASAYGMTKENVKNLVTPEGIQADLKNQKALDFLKENASVNEEKPQKEEKKPAAKKSAGTKKTSSTKTAAAKKPAAKKTTKKKAEETPEEPQEAPAEEKTEG